MVERELERHQQGELLLRSELRRLREEVVEKTVEANTLAKRQVAFSAAATSTAIVRGQSTMASESGGSWHETVQAPTSLQRPVYQQQQQQQQVHAHYRTARHSDEPIPHPSSLY